MTSATVIEPPAEPAVPLLRRRRTRCLVLAALVMAGLAASGSDASAAGAGAGNRTTSVTVPTKIPAGTVLRVGDQLDYLKTVLGLAGEDQHFPYKVEYSAFVGGPPMLQAFQAGSIDTGFVGSTPLIFAQAARQHITAVAGWVTSGGTYDLVTAPGTKGISGWRDLKGKRVTFQQGTAGEAALLQALDKVGLKLSDVSAVNLPIVQASAALQGGSVDAGLLVEPLTSVYLGSTRGAHSVAQASEITDRSDFVIATKDTLDDKGKAAALGDYISRLVRAFAYTSAHPEKIAEAVYEQQYHLPAERALVLAKRGGGTSFVTLPGAVVKAQQRLANLFYQAGEIPAKVDVRQEFDTRYNAVVQAVGQQSR
ncbi:MAG TPA: ABC transporter substrate-binding protein [Acidimicrobiia bacterium]|nr:ABC transporter substrate-binding protein [Acidimicrobiia bacterium]